MVELLPNCPYSNLEMLESLRLVCCWIMNRASLERTELLANQTIRNIINKLAKTLDINSPPIRYFSSISYKSMSNEMKPIISTLYGEMIMVAKESSMKCYWIKLIDL